jgi:anthranilate synthase component 1
VRSLRLEDYERLSQGGARVPVYREIPGDLVTPVSAFAALSARSERAFLLESVLGGERVARYSFLGRDPRSSIEVRPDGVFERGEDGERALSEPLIPALRRKLGPPAALVPELPRFTGGAVGYLTWDAARLFERLPDRHAALPGPLAAFAFYDSLVAFDHALQRLVLIAVAEPGGRRAFQDAQRRLDTLEADLRQPIPMAAAASGAPLAVETDFADGPRFREAVVRAKEYIAAGDAFQVVLSRRHAFDCPLPPFSVYRALRMVNPSPYMYFLKEGDSAVAGASPEMLVRVEAGRVETHPIAGTRPRGADEDADRQAAASLLADEKERAEHLMLVDLGRNDLGRVCRFSSVTVPQFMEIERYSHVMHIVSRVVGELSEGRDALDALVAAFPAGTLSGAPKIRAMEIIDELEPVRRGLYGGALGYIDLAGNLDFCIAIRTLLLRGGKALVQTGAGIVADSDPAYEQAETEAKAAAMVEALRLAGTLR